MWLKKLQMKLRRRAFANTVLLHCSRLLSELLEDENDDTRQKVQESTGSRCFDIIKERGSHCLPEFRKDMIEKVLGIVRSDNPVITMRKEIIHTIHSNTINRMFFLEKFKDRRQELYKLFDESLDTQTKECVHGDKAVSELFFWSEAECCILRMLQGVHFEEIDKDDWFSKYTEAYSIYIEMMFEVALKLKSEEECSIEGVTFTTAMKAIQVLEKRLIGELITSPSKERWSEDRQTTITNQSSARETADDPVLFAEWIAKYAILKHAFEDDMKLAPSEDICRRNNISDKERKLCANEFVLMRTLGACSFVRSNLDEAYYLKFRETLLPLVQERMKRHAPYMHNVDVSSALEQYMEDMKSDSHVGFSMTYLDRVYPDTDKAEGIFIVGIPIHCGFLYATEFLEHTRDGYCLLKTGMKYKALEKIQEVLDAGQSADS